MLSLYESSTIDFNVSVNVLKTRLELCFLNSEQKLYYRYNIQNQRICNYLHDNNFYIDESDVWKPQDILCGLAHGSRRYIDLLPECFQEQPYIYKIINGARTALGWATLSESGDAPLSAFSFPSDTDT